VVLKFGLGPLGKVINFLPLLGFEPENVQPAAWSLSSPGYPSVFDTSLLLKCKTLLLRTKENTTTPPLASLLNGNRSLADDMYFSDWERGGGCEFGGDVTRTNGKIPAVQTGTYRHFGTTCRSKVETKSTFFLELRN